jgi:hypothetical protein
MKIITFLVSINLLLCILNLNAQKSDSIRTKTMLRRAILPSVIIFTGSIINGSQFEKDLQENLRNKVGNSYECHIDNYLPFVPVAEMYIADIARVKSKNHWFNQTKYLIISNLITSGITHTIKNISLKTRPNGGDLSFPSGHTSFAFNNATVLFQEFRDTAPVIAYSGYAFSTTTGIFRMLNNKHWLSDVLVGAGIGILVTDLVYYFEPFKNFNPFKNRQDISIIPFINNDKYGFYFSYQF